jgi:hypothetical protein
VFQVTATRAGSKASIVNGPVEGLSLFLVGEATPQLYPLVQALQAGKLTN